ncbi:T-complex protein 1 subunit gamma (Fragment) [Linum perenne]
MRNSESQCECLLIYIHSFIWGEDKSLYSSTWPSLISSARHLGPRSMLKMLLVSLIELSRTQDEEVGDGTTSVIVLGCHGCGQKHT